MNKTMLFICLHFIFIIYYFWKIESAQNQNLKNTFLIITFPTKNRSAGKRGGVASRARATYVIIAAAVASSI